MCNTTFCKNIISTVLTSSQDCRWKHFILIYMILWLWIFSTALQHIYRCQKKIVIKKTRTASWWLRENVIFYNFTNWSRLILRRIFLNKICTNIYSKFSGTAYYVIFILSFNISVNIISVRLWMQCAYLFLHLCWCPVTDQVRLSTIQLKIT